MGWLGVTMAVAAGTAAAPLLRYVVRAIGLVVLIAIGIAIFG
jgi:hypothetical protein